MRSALLLVHVMAAAAWVGGMICFVALMMPWVRERDEAARRDLMRAFGHRFRRYAWTCFLVLAATGPVLAWLRWRAWPDPATLPGQLLLAKVALLAMAVAFNRCDSARVSRAVARWTGRLSLVAGVLAIACAIALTRQ